MWSGRRDSNPRPPPWQGGALPLSHFRSRPKHYTCAQALRKTALTILRVGGSFTVASEDRRYALARVAKSIEIDAPREHVFALATDIGRQPDWTTFVKEGLITSGDGKSGGTRDRT